MVVKEGRKEWTMKRTFEQAVRANIKREGAEDLLRWLEFTDFYTAPASTRYHGAHEGGLVEHSLDVFAHLNSLNAKLECNFEPEPLAVVSLFHDLCKVNLYTVSLRNSKNEKTGMWEKVPYYTHDEKFVYGGHGSKSVFLAQSFMKLSGEEAAAINNHMGAWDRSEYANPGAVYERNLLAWLLHVADEAATYCNDILRKG